MHPITLVLVACLPHTADCRFEVQHPAPATHEECDRRAEKLQQTLAGSIDDAGYQPIQVTCTYEEAQEKDRE
jgi:hypothetical protein